VVLRAHRERLVDQDTERLAWAWYVARLIKAKHMPSLAALIAPAKDKPSIDQSRADHDALVAAARNN
jgi:hypothetical protein